MTTRAYETARIYDWFRGSPTDNEILMLWRGGKDTYEIAKQLWVPEHYIAGILPRVLLRDRQDQEWNFDRLASPPRG